MKSWGAVSLFNCNGLVYELFIIWILCTSALVQSLFLVNCKISLRYEVLLNPWFAKRRTFEVCVVTLLSGSVITSHL